MKTSESYLPEGSYMVQPAVRQAFSTLGALRQAQDEGRILEAVAQRCTAAHDLLFDLGIAQGILPRVSCALGVAEGDTREIAILARVGNPTSCAGTENDESTDPPTAWLNAALFSVGETVRGIVRSIEPYGVFIELTPNLSGLAEPRADLRPGMAVSVYIKSILPQRMKVKLTVIDVLAPYDAPTPPRYFITEGHIDEWVYTPACCDKKIVKTIFG